MTDNEAVFWLEVSPAFQRTGFALAVSLPLRGGCAGDCFSLWVTRDGGAKWRRIKSRSLPSGFRPVIALDSEGREILFGRGANDLLRSDDGGETWTAVGPRGSPTVSPNFARDGVVAVAGEPDYIWRGGGIEMIGGSSRLLGDFAFMLAPDFPNSGPNPPALLVGLQKETTRPLIQQCTAGLSCTGSAVLIGSGIYRYPVLFYPSNGYATDGTLFVSTGQVYKSADGGRTFDQLKIVDSAAIGSAVPMLALAPGYQESGPVRTAYAALSQVFTKTGSGGAVTRYREGGIYKTTDGGKTWKRVGDKSALDEGTNAIAVAPDGRLFAGFLRGRFDGGLLCSEDDGRTWHRSCRAIGAAKDSKTSSQAVASDTAEAQGSFVGSRSFWTMVLLGLVALATVVGAVLWGRKTTAVAGLVDAPATAGDAERRDDQ